MVPRVWAVDQLLHRVTQAGLHGIGSDIAFLNGLGVLPLSSLVEDLFILVAAESEDIDVELVDKLGLESLLGGLPDVAWRLLLKHSLVKVKSLLVAVVPLLGLRITSLSRVVVQDSSWLLLGLEKHVHVIMVVVEI